MDHDFSVSNEELLEACKRQDQEALRVLLRRHERPVYSLLHRMLSSHEDAEEALAEVFVKVWKSAAGFKGDARFTTWLYRIASNTARDALRARRKRAEVSTEDVLIDELEVSERAASAATDPVRSVLVAEDTARILSAMQELSDEDRLLITLYHFQESDYEEISEITGISPSNLKVKLFRARQRLRELCSDKEKEDNRDEVRSDTTGSSGLQQGAADWA